MNRPRTVLRMLLIVGFTASFNWPGPGQSGELWVCRDGKNERLQDHGGPGCTRQRHIEETTKPILPKKELRQMMLDMFIEGWKRRGWERECTAHGLVWWDEYERRSGDDQRTFLHETRSFAQRCIYPLIVDIERQARQASDRLRIQHEMNQLREGR